jgi:hypothetical protein
LFNNKRAALQSVAPPSIEIIPPPLIPLKSAEWKNFYRMKRTPTAADLNWKYGSVLHGTLKWQPLPTFYINYRQPRDPDQVPEIDVTANCLKTRVF